MAMLHQEMEYFVPQMQTKTMNEGWASIWHSRIMRELDLPTRLCRVPPELHPVCLPSQGATQSVLSRLQDIRGHREAWDNPSAEEREKFGRLGGEGREKIFEVREIENDISFLRNYLTEELCEELDLFVYQLVDEEEWTITEKKWERVRDQLVSNMTNFGFPYIEVVDGDYDGNRELYLIHRYDGVEMDMKYARKTLEYVHKLWGRDVLLKPSSTKSVVLRYNGSDHDED